MLKIRHENKHIAAFFSKIKWQLIYSWVEERQGLSGEELKTLWEMKLRSREEEWKRQEKMEVGKSLPKENRWGELV